MIELFIHRRIRTFEIILYLKRYDPSIVVIQSPEDEVSVRAESSWKNRWKWYNFYGFAGEGDKCFICWLIETKARRGRDGGHNS